MRRLSSPSHCQPISSPGCGGTAYLQRRTSHPRLFGTLNVLANPPLRLCCADDIGSPRGTERDGELAPRRRHRRQHGAGQGPGVRRMVWKASPRPTAASRHGRGHSFDVTRATAEDSQPVSLKRVRVRVLHRSLSANIDPPPLPQHLTSATQRHRPPKKPPSGVQGATDPQSLQLPPGVFPAGPDRYLRNNATTES